MAEPKYAIFIEPEGALKDLIRTLKDQVSAVEASATYLGHPAHMTLLFGSYAPPSEWLTALSETAASCAPFEIKAAGWRVFAADQLAGGGDTIAVEITQTTQLLSLQERLAQTLAAHQRGNPRLHPLAAKEPFATSLVRYGFPFVGPHWIPHFTVASLATGQGKGLIPAIKAQDCLFSCRIDHASLWAVAGDAHQRIATLKLSGHPV